MKAMCWCGGALIAGRCQRDATHAQAELVEPPKAVPIKLGVLRATTPKDSEKPWVAAVYMTDGSGLVTLIGPSFANVLARGLDLLAAAYDKYVEHEMFHLAKELSDQW